MSERKIEEPNIIIHAAGIHIWLSEIGAIKESKEEIVELFQAYINDLYNQKRLKPSSNSEREFRRYESYGGLGVIHFDSPEVKLLATLMEELRNKAKEDLYPSFAASTLNEMAVDTRLFYRRLNFTNNSDDNSYADIPILASIKPEVFVEKLFELENTDRELVLAAINARHSPPPPGGALAIEIPWISEVVSVIKPKLDTMHAVHRWGLSRAVARYLEALIT